MALRKDSAIASMVDRCVVMGGAANTVGNISPAAEFNVYVDPEAARVVFQSGMPIEMVGWELCRGAAALSDNEMAKVKGFDNPLAHFVIDCNATALRTNREWLGEPGMGLPDPVAMAVALDPSVALRVSFDHEDVETGSDLTRGMTIVDELKVTGRDPNVRVCREIDVRRWKEILYETLRTQ
jgi:purine nucleosidase